MANSLSNEILWKRISGAVEAVRRRLEKACAALESAGIPHAVAGGNAVAVWVGTIDEGAIRNTRDVNILLRRADLARATDALEKAGFVAEKSFGVTMFLEGPNAKPSESVHILFAGEKVREDYADVAPDVTASEMPTTYRVVSLEPLVRMKLTSNRDKDRTHIRDMIGVGLIDASWIERLPPTLAERLAEILANPDG
jgi:hypothetical protein